MSVGGQRAAAQEIYGDDGCFAGICDADGWVADDDAALLRYQRAWYFDRSAVKVIVKSRQIGITFTTACEAVEVAGAKRSDGGMDVYFMSVSREDARQFIEDCVVWIRWLTPVIGELLDVQETEFAGDGSADEDWFTDDDGNRILAFRIDFPSGFTIYALPSRPARLRGKQGYAICDEAAQQDVDAWMTAAGGLLTWGGRLALISTYNGVDNGFYRFIEDIEAGEQGGRVHRVDIYEAVADGLYKRICETRPSLGVTWSPEAESDWLESLRKFYGAHRFAQECECIASRGGDTLYPAELVKRCQILGPSDCTIFEARGGPHPGVWVDNTLRDSVRKPWELDTAGAATPDERRKKMRAWLDAYLSPMLASITATGLPAYVGLDFGRTGNLSSFPIGVLRRDMTRQIRGIVELEKMPWPEQDAVLDYMWERLPNLAGGCADKGAGGGPSAERCNERTDGKITAIQIGAAWHDANYTVLQKRMDEESIHYPRHFAPVLADLTSLRRAGSKIVAPQRISKDDRKQKRHADLAVALALLEQSIGMDGPSHKPKTGRIGLRRHRKR